MGEPAGKDVLDNVRREFHRGINDWQDHRTTPAEHLKFLHEIAEHIQSHPSNPHLRDDARDCATCHSAVSSDARACRKCGKPVNKQGGPRHTHGKNADGKNTKRMHDMGPIPEGGEPMGSAFVCNKFGRRQRSFYCKS
jgi:hypothetical protein